MNLIQLKQSDNHYLLSIPNVLIERAKKIVPNEWDSVNQVWKYPRNINTFDLLINEFSKDIEYIEISPPESNTINQENPFAKKNKIIRDQQKKIESLELEIIERENEIDHCISKIVDLREKINHLISNDIDIEKVIKKVAKQCVGNNKRYLKIIEEIEFDVYLPIELPKKQINILKTILKAKDQKYNFGEIIFECKQKNFLSSEAISLLHIMREQRNIVAHRSPNPNTRYMRTILLVAAFALVAEEIESKLVEKLNSDKVDS